ncbi:interleukin-31 receptor subunit alpha isoform X2 [Struthio camelus]|uniref:interleukin-31 receptor subunit alpha isoform X2 n=1 Tax=Struthio camelus TaxID=8801 RepID=UPI003604009C
MFYHLIWMLVLLCRSSAADENSVRDVEIFPSSPEIERGSTLKLFCVLGKHYMPHRNASHIIWKLNHELITQENYNIVNETVSSVTIHNFTYSKAHVKCFIKYLGKEQLLVHTEVKSGFPPDAPGNISCVYYFDAELACSWTSGRQTNLTTSYTLYRKMMRKRGVTILNTVGSSCQSKTESCSFYYPNTPYSSSFCFQVKAENVLGEASSDCVPIAMEKIEKFEPPEILSVQKIAGIKQLLTVTWKKPEKIIPSQDLNCRVRYRNLYSNFSLLNHFPSPGRILGYRILYFPENSAALKMMNITTDEKIILLLNEEAYIISVTAYNSAGDSPEAILRIPSTDEKTSQIIETVRTFTANEEVAVEWMSSRSEVTRYVVEWYEELEPDPFRRSWQYISNSTNWRTNKKTFRPFICYNISVYPLYGNKVGAPYSIQTYIQEKKPSEGPMADTGVPGKNEITIKWKEISKDKRNGFISNYTIFYKPEGGKELNETVNPDVLQYRLKSLQANTQYTVHIMATNEAGGTSGEPKTFKTLKFNKEDIISIAIPVGLSMLFLLVLWITCILKKHMFKKVCWPDIPNPAESIAVEWPVDASVNNSFLRGVTSEDKTIGGLEDVCVLEPCFPEEHEDSLLMNHENRISEYTDINTKVMINRDKNIPYNEEHEAAKHLSASMPYTMTDQDFRSQVLSALIPAEKIQPIEMLEDYLHEHQDVSNQNEENKEEVLNLSDLSEKAVFNPYLKNSVNTREFLISENLAEHSKSEPKSQSTAISPFQQNVVGQSYVTLDMFGLATAH